MGNKGWFRRNKQKARFDQQPLEAQSIISACRQAYEATRNKTWIDAARLCFDWYLGKNDLNLPLYDYRTGGCYDGLSERGLNENQGAESTLAWIISLLEIKSLEFEENDANK